MLCGDLNGKEIQKRDDICIHIVDSLHPAAVTVKQLYPNKKQTKNILKHKKKKFFIVTILEGCLIYNLYVHIHNFPGRMLE